MVRDEIPVAMRWKLEDIFESNDAWERCYALTQGKIAALPALQGKLNQDIPTLKRALDQYYDVRLDLHRLNNYSMMRLSENSADTTYQALRDRAISLSVSLDEQTAFFAPELLENEQLDQWMDAPELALYRRYLGLVRRDRPHTLTRAEEALLAMTGELAASPGNTYDMLVLADMKFPMVNNEAGEEIQLTHGNFIPLLESADRQVRQSAYEALYSTYRSQINTITSTFTGQVKAHMLEAKARKFADSRHAAVFGNELPTSVYDQLIATIRKHLPQLHRYAELRKKLLGVEELRAYDLYTPIVPKFEVSLPYDEAYDLVCEGLEILGPEYVEVLRRARDERWVDVYENPGKMSGAYMCSVYGVHPYVLLNYQPTLDNVSTIAHEMGHAMHSYYSQRLPYPYAGYPIFLAEVASTVNEVLLHQHLLRKYPQPEAQLYLLSELLEQIRGTVFRQTMFAEFEMILHNIAERGEAITHELLCAEYGKLLSDYFGPALVVDDFIRAEWARIPHFFMDFYVYQYATGYSAASLLATRVGKGEPGAREDLFTFLTSGGSQPPLDTLRAAGADMESPDPVEACMALFTRTLDELEKLV